jgi:hypothetical protein
MNVSRLEDLSAALEVDQRVLIQALATASTSELSGFHEDESAMAT